MPSGLQESPPELLLGLNPESGVFAVRKKRGRLRLVFDCRQANLLCRVPDKSHLSTSAALCGLRIRHGAAYGRLPFEGSVISLDLEDSFYLFRWQELSEFFSLDYTFTASQLGIRTALNAEGAWEPVAPQDSIYVCLSRGKSIFFPWQVCHTALVAWAQKTRK